MQQKAEPGDAVFVRFRCTKTIHRLYKSLCAEEGTTFQEDLEAFVLHRLQEAGKLPKTAPQ